MQPARQLIFAQFKSRCMDCVVKTLIEVRHVLDLKKNLISLSVMNGKGYKRSEKDIF